MSPGAITTGASTADANTRWSHPERAQLYLLGLAQIVGWGSLYYALAVLAKAIEIELQTTPVVVYGAYTFGLLVSGLLAPTVGRLIDQGHGKAVMSAGCLIAALAFILMATTTHVLQFVCAWALAGVAMATTLYEAMFAVIHTLFTSRYRRAVTLLTLIAGLASTVFWPLIAHWQLAFGWRSSLIMLAALQVLISFPIYFFALRHLGKRTLSIAAMATITPTGAGWYWLLASFASSTFVFAVMSAFFIECLQGRGYSNAQTLWLGALVGPMQIGGRLLLSALPETKMHRVSVAAMLALLCALVLLILVPPSPLIGVLFATGYGLAVGTMTIVRAVLPPHLFGRHAVGALLGSAGRITFLAKALAPAGFALLLSMNIHINAALWLLLGCAVFALLALQLSLRSKHERVLNV